MTAIPAMGGSDDVRIAVAVPYLALVVYTWIADPLVNLWVRIRPAK